MEQMEVDGLGMLALRFLAWIAVWVVLWYALSLSGLGWARCLPESTKEHENNIFWIVRNVIGGIHALFVSVLAVPAMIAFSTAPDDVRFASSPHLEMCNMDADFYPGERWNSYIQAVALGGLAFTAFTTADVVLSTIHGLASIDYMVHHAAFIIAGLIMRGNCVLPWKGSVQLAMEASTPLLNFMLLFQNRGPAWFPWVIGAGVLFVISYIYLRLIQNTYATTVLWLRRESALPARVPRWQVWILLLAVTVGAGVQFFWFPAIIRRILRMTPYGSKPAGEFGGVGHLGPGGPLQPNGFTSMHPEESLVFRPEMGGPAPFGSQRAGPVGPPQAFGPPGAPGFPPGSMVLNSM